MNGRPVWVGVLLLSALAGTSSTEENDEEALSALTQGNTLMSIGEAAKAIAMWERAAALRPDSNVPWSNIANAYASLNRTEDALNAARQASEIKLDYLSSVTLSNVLKTKREYRDAEATLLGGIEHSIKSNDLYEYPFWSLASLYFEQGDYLAGLNYSKQGFEHHRGACLDEEKRDDASCMKDLEQKMSHRIYNVCMFSLFPLPQTNSPCCRASRCRVPHE